MSNDKKSLIHVFLSENSDKTDASKVINPPMKAAPKTDKTDKNVSNVAKKRDDKKVKDVNAELDSYKSILEGPFDDAYEQHEKDEDDKEQNRQGITNNLKECGMELDSPEHEAMETPEEETMEHIPGGSEYEEPVDFIVIKIGHEADDEMKKTGMPAFNVGKSNDSFGAPGSPNIEDGIDDEEHSLGMMQESFDPKRWQKLAGILKECPMDNMTMKENETLMEMDPFNELADDPEFDDEGMPIDKDDHNKIKDMEDEKFVMGDKRSDRPGKR